MLDELKNPYHGNSELVTFTNRKPHPWGEDIWLVCARLSNGRPYCLGFKFRLVAGHHYTVVEIAEDLLHYYFSQPEFHLTVDAFYDAAALRNLISQRAAKEKCSWTYTFSGHTGHDQSLWRPLHTEVQKGSWVCWHNNTTGEIATTVFDEHAFNTRSTHFTLPKHPREVSDSALRGLYKSEFNAVDLFNKLFYRKYWRRREKDIHGSQFNGILQVLVVNAFTVYTVLHPQSQWTVVDFMLALAEQLLAVPGSN